MCLTRNCVPGRWLAQKSPAMALPDYQRNNDRLRYKTIYIYIWKETSKKSFLKAHIRSVWLAQTQQNGWLLGVKVPERSMFWKYLAKELTKLKWFSLLSQVHNSCVSSTTTQFSLYVFLWSMKSNCSVCLQGPWSFTESVWAHPFPLCTIL